MIRIDTIQPFGKKSQTTLLEFRKTYFDQLRNAGNVNPLSILTDAISTGNLYGVQLSSRDKRILRFFIKWYRPIILGSPEVLEWIMRNVERRGWASRVAGKKKAKRFADALTKAFGYETRFRSDQNRGVWLAKQLNTKSCPYCNSQFTMLVERDDDEFAAKFQFDHFFPKSKYPYLSVSLFNLIPSCANCNLKKDDKPLSLSTHYHPYYNNIALFSRFRIAYPAAIEKQSFTAIRDMKLDDLKITYQSRYKRTKSFVENHDELFDITPTYQRHKDIAHEILVKAILYNRFYQKGTVKIEGLFPDKETLLRYVLGNYMEESDMLKRPLAKFTQDAAKQLKLF